MKVVDTFSGSKNVVRLLIKNNTMQHVTKLNIFTFNKIVFYKLRLKQTPYTYVKIKYYVKKEHLWIVREITEISFSLHKITRGTNNTRADYLTSD